MIYFCVDFTRRKSFGWRDEVLLHRQRAGDQVRLEIQGEYLLLSQGDTFLDLGSSVEVREIDIQDVDTARFTVEISDDTSPGSLDLTLASGDLQLVQTDAFQILADSDRPTLLNVEPDALEQGERATICILLNTPLEGADLQLDLAKVAGKLPSW